MIHSLTGCMRWIANPPDPVKARLRLAYGILDSASRACCMASQVWLTPNNFYSCGCPTLAICVIIKKIVLGSSMKILIIGIIIVLFLIIISRARQSRLNKSLSNDDLLRLSNLLPPMNNITQQHLHDALECTTTARCNNYSIKRYNAIKDKKDFRVSMDALNDALFDADKVQDKYLVNQLAYYMVKYYTKLILEHGSPRDRAVLVNMATLVMMSTATIS